VTPVLVREAHPRTLKEVGKLNPRPAVVAAARERGISEIVHFTMMKNLIGILSTALLCRSLVSSEHYVQAVYDPNCSSRYKDAAWIDYVNLSISRINPWMFGPSRRWHPGATWVILSFDVEILGHPGVVFTTTNNAYDTCLRAEGLAGFKRMFEDPVSGYNGRQKSRSHLDPNMTTDHGAEVLYPISLDMSYVRTIYAQKDEDMDDIAGILGGLGLSVDYVVNEGAFRT
jgi:hypothetical protein